MFFFDAGKWHPSEALPRYYPNVNSFVPRILSLLKHYSDVFFKKDPYPYMNLTASDLIMANNVDSYVSGYPG